MAKPEHRAVKGQRSWRSSVASCSRRQKVLAALAPASLAGVVAGIIVLAGGGATPAVTGRPGPVPPIRQAAVTDGARWVDGSAEKLLAAVNADLARLSTTETAGSGSTARAAGAQLAAGGAAALAGPMPPAQAMAYRSALKDLREAGTDTADGDFTKARRLLAAGTTILTKVTAAVDLPRLGDNPAVPLKHATTSVHPPHRHHHPAPGRSAGAVARLR